MGWLATSILLSVGLTVIVNVALRAIPDAGDRMGRRVDELTERAVARADDGRVRRVGVWFPWRVIVIVSVVLTVVLTVIVNVAAWLR